jgi:hypothetical protein
MYKEPIYNYKSRIYICKKTGVTQDEYLNQIETYDEPQKFMWNVQPVNASSEGKEFGQLVSALRVAVVPKRKYQGKFHEFDKVYIDTAPSSEELDFGDNADYRIYSIRPQNAVLKIYFLKLVNNSVTGE